MAKISNETVERWTQTAREFLARSNHALDVVTSGREAWAVAHHSGFTREAYADRDIVDAHIQTALQKVFPNCAFRDAKRY